MPAASPLRPASPMENPAQAQIPVIPVQQSAMAPLRDPLFRSLWIAAVISYTGSWMQNVATGWLMTSLTSSPMWVSMVQVALSLPVLLIALPAGALADLLDRRKFLLITQASMVGASMVLGILTVTGTCTPTLLLILTFLLGAGAVMNDPAWQALTPDLVPVSKLASAVALNSAGFNIARAVGPAIGGIVVATAGSGTAFLLNALSFFGVILFLYRWNPGQRESREPGGSVSHAIATGFAYVRQQSRIRAVLVRTLGFSIFASAFWALLPLVASRFGAEGYGMMLGFFGLGALAGALLLGRVRRRFSYDGVLASATVVFALALSGLVRTNSLAVSSALAAAAGLAWISTLATLNFVAQTSCPGWVRARVISMYVLVLQGGLAIGSAGWGVIASREGVQSTLTIAAAAMVVSLLLTLWYRLQHEQSN